jgi:hypothetical protein
MPLVRRAQLNKDYEELPTISETFVYVAMTRLIVSSLPILEKGEQFPGAICIPASLCSHY